MAGRRRASNLIALASGLLLCVAACSTPREEPVPEVTLDLLDQDWASMPGVMAGADGLRVSAIGSRIVEQDGTGGQPNPPVLLGTHLAVGRDFSISATLDDVSADASLALYDKPPVIADEFRIEPAGIRLTIRGDDLEISVWDGSPQDDVTRPQPVYDEHVTVSDPAAPLTVSRSGGNLEVASKGKTVATVGEGDVFTSGKLWLGLSSDAGSFLVSSLTASGRSGGDLRAVDSAHDSVTPTPDGLQALAAQVRPDFRIGAALALGPLTTDADYAGAALSNFGSVTPENAMKPQFLSPERGVYSFQEADALIAIAHRNGMSVHGHTIAFSEAMPQWMRNLPTGTEAERSSSAAALLDYVRAVVTHFKGRLDSLDVVNEPFDVDQGTDMQRNIWYSVFGPGYPAIVSQAVYAVDPDVKQFINENGADLPGARQDALLQLALDTNAAGGHIYGVGLQAHVYDFETDALPADELTRSFERFRESGLRVRISENDVTGDDGPSAQADQYAAVLAACFQHPNCVSYTTWGVDDRYDWWIDDDGSLQQGHDLLFDDGEPTAAY
ncbi:MAG: glycoside hydrolase family 10, partial [Blastococcus sp.]|nr:glycoside hydrolase family 10 [Blastococcus sp.]